jgi:hypothetical protein
VSISDAVGAPVSTGASDRASRIDRLRIGLAARESLVVLVVVLCLGALYEWHFLFRGWVPWDEGALSEGAQRVLSGELPHRDFEEIYTGGLNYLHALAFLLFGEKLASMRLVLFAFFVAWIPVLYAIARRFASPPAAGACVLACVAWSLPNYSASMPSWYNLFFATFAVGSLFRYLESRNARWTVAAGLACGLSLIVKSTGIYVVIALFLVLLFDEQLRGDREAGRRQWPYSAFLLTCAGASVAFLIALLHSRLGAGEAANFLVPATSVVAVLVWNELRLGRGAPSARFHALIGPLASFGVGLAIPLVVLVGPYVATNSVGSLLHGVLIEPSSRLEFAALRPLTISSLPITLLVLTGLVGLAYAVARGGLGERAAAVGILAIWFALTTTSYGFRVTWVSVRDASVFLVPIGIVSLGAALRRRAASDRVESARTFALLALFAFATLIQFPWSGPTYFYYVAPLMFLAALALATRWRKEDRHVLPSIALVSLFLFLAAFGVVRVNEQAKGGSVTIRGGTSLDLPRSGALRVSAADSRLYRRVLAQIRKRPGRYIYAGPDAPELYFLADRRNPTRASFEFFDHGPAQDRELLRALDDHGVAVIALNRRPSFSPPLDSRLLAALAVRYPRHERIGRFELRWRR